MSADDLNIQPKLIRLLANPDFDSSKFVKDIYQSGDENDLIEAKIRVQNLYDETAQQLKKNVYKNNSIFIDTARDVSYLESEMYQLNHLLNDQKNVINYLETLSILNTKYAAPKNDKDKDNVDSSKKLFSSLVEDIEGNNPILIYKDQTIWFQGELLQIEETQAGKCIPVQKCHCFVLDDVFIMCTLSASSIPYTPPRRSLLYNALNASNQSSMEPPPLPIGSGNHVLKFQHCYPLTSLAVINVKDDQSARQTEAVSGLIKFLMFPETLILKASNDKSKREWLQAVDLAKKALIKGSKMNETSTSSDDKGTKTERVNPRSSVVEVSRPIDSVDGPAPFTKGRDVSSLEDWVLDFPDELDMFIAQRQFDDAVDLIEKVKPTLAYHQANTSSVSSNLPIVQELSVQLSQLIDRLVDTLYSEITGFDDADDNLNIIGGRGGTFGFSVPTASSGNLGPGGSGGGGKTGSNSFFGPASTSPPSSTNISTLRYRPPRTLVARAVLLLIRLGKANQARTLYLSNRSALIRHRLADLKLEGNLALYIEKLGNVFFGIVAETRDEIDLFFNQPPAPVPPPRASKITPNVALLKPKENPVGSGKDDQIDASASLASFAVWLSKYELKNFAGYVLRQIEGIRTNFSLVVRCLAVSRSQCLMLSDAIINLDIIYAFDTLTNVAIAKMTEEQGEKMGEASRAKICDDDWAPQTFANKEALEKCLSELRELGLPPLNTVTLPYSARASKLSLDMSSLPTSKEVANTKYELVDFEACKLRLARSSTTFLKIYLNFVRDISHIYTPERYKIFREVLLHTFLNHLQYLTVYLKSPKFRNSRDLYELIHANARFMLRCLVPVLNELWAETVGYRDDFKTLDVTVEDILEINGNPTSDNSPSTPTADKNTNSKPVQFL